MKIIKKLLHLLAHLAGWNYGHVYFWNDDNGKRMAGFRCNSCDVIAEVYELPPEYQSGPICLTCEERERHEQA